MLTLARVDASTATVVSCVRDDCTGRVGDHWLKVYHVMLSFFFWWAFNQLIESMRTFVQDSVPADLTVSSVSFLNSAAVFGESIQREAKIETLVYSDHIRRTSKKSNFRDIHPVVAEAASGSYLTVVFAVYVR